MDRKLPQEPQPNSPEAIYKNMFDQLQRIAQSLEGKPIYRSEDNVDEYCTIVFGKDASSFTFETTNFNIANPSSQEGAYENTFTFSFDYQSLFYTYMEALPRRQQQWSFYLSNKEQAAQIREKLLPFVEKLNALFEYFHIIQRVQLPSDS
ncbi:hypothetical protein C5B42_02715 [Candidatus Cerribacteria bacterium 'Amazon FNV 2010 28 9']|uniref:Uncharacterized protein n=1 Tax=Candidatus Cerribacteria bacterium 'Amazon FNV 2010 28 9' TaxID=2081795 RepID=A0A317JQ98_9BACT|nr:MAG: hypothetical protein C5B42_02715 [Candidatus Cerribacteria bacterium 'Amazon FNV 2010 28 9']